MKLKLALLALLLASPAWAADNTVILSPAPSGGGNVTMRSKDVGAGLESMLQILGDTSGNAIYGTAGTANTNVLTIQGIASGTAVPVSFGGTVTTNPSAGPMLGAVTTNAPSYSASTNQALSLTTTGDLRALINSSQLLASGTTAPGTDPGAGIAVLCQNGASPTVSAAQTVALQCNGTGQLITTSGAVAQGSTTSGQTGFLMLGSYLASPPTYSAGTTNALLTDLHGNVMVNVAAGSAANSAASATGSAVPANAGYTGLNVAGNNTGWTGTSVSAIRAGDVNLALLNGVAPLLGAGTEANVFRVTLPTNGTGQVAISQITPGTTNGVSPVLTTGGGWTPLALPGLTNTATAIKASAGQLGYLYCMNNGTSTVYAQLFNTASGSVVVGTTANVGPIGIPPSSNGGLPMSFPGIQFSTAISIAVTQTATGAGAPSPVVDCAAGFV